MLLAHRAYLSGDLVLRWEGRATDAPPEAGLAVEVAPGRWLQPAGEPAQAVAHACRPTCGLFEEAEGPALRALGTIRYGEAVTLDYATWTSRRSPWAAARCDCGAAGCRGAIGSWETLPPEVRRGYRVLGAVPAWLREAEG
jgi:hypothetical protein